MVKKLIKHEFIYYLRSLLIVYPVMLVMGLFTCIVQFLQNETIWYLIIQIGSYTLLVFASVVCLFLATILGVIRFYKNMYSSEGYLTFTLPISNKQHLFSKVITFITCQVVSFIVVCVAWLLALAPHLHFLPEVLNALAELISLIKPLDIILFIFESIIILLLSLIYTPLLYYSCISIGQLAKKNRILLAIGVYYIYNVVVQAISTIGSAVFTLVGTLGAFEGIFTFIGNYPSLSFHGFMWIMIIISAGVSFAFYLINLKIMNNKLNLE